MKPIDYVSALNEMYQSQGFPPYRWSEFDTSPWSLPGIPLNEGRLALISSAGISRDDQPPFDPWAVNDLSFRQIPIDTPHERLRLNHNYFDHRDAVKDLNCVFPVERLKELEAEGYIGSLAPTAITLGMGRLYKRTALQNETVPEILAVLKREGTDFVLLVPA
ncbi:MAG: glycine/sarcosine/betaine reductase selenoprotein B family protein [Candidatus Abyssubacteria bacterium]